MFLFAFFLIWLNLVFQRQMRAQKIHYTVYNEELVPQDFVYCSQFLLHPSFLMNIVFLSPFIPSKSLAQLAAIHLNDAYYIGI